MLSPTKILGCQKLLVGKFSSIVAKNPLWINLGGGQNIEHALSFLADVHGPSETLNPQHRCTHRQVMFYSVMPVNCC